MNETREIIPASADGWSVGETLYLKHSHSLQVI